MTAVATTERELSKNLQALVDTCFEEGQYEAGIDLLLNICTPKARPFAPHVRQVLYMALYPPPPENDPAAITAGNISPSKINLKRKRSALLPTPEATAAANRCMFHMALACSPASIMRAIPSYPPPGVGNFVMKDEDEDESYIARVTHRCFTHIRTCWDVLREGFVRRKRLDVPGDNRRGRRIADDVDAEEEELEEGVEESAVGRHAWLVLEWLIMIFKNDQDAHVRNGTQRHSPLLLAQIPPSKTGQGPRWDAKEPLDVVFCCMDQADIHKRSLGGDLMSLLVNLTSSPDFDTSIFADQVVNRTAASVDTLSNLFLASTPSPALNTFKTVVYVKCLGIPAPSATGSSRPKARGRLPPRARRIGAADPELSGPNPIVTPRDKPPNPDEVVNVLGAPSAAPDAGRLKCELLLSCVPHQGQEWHAFKTGGRIAEVMQEVFEQEGIDQHVKDVVSIAFGDANLNPSCFVGRDGVSSSTLSSSTSDLLGVS
ncbi:hypothetical protein PUNSTDRAFT_131989 [Punctularia strigosozonata HHB-11173 SS5]|uniref:uncharacterized protein n=1 Tax=Punctularia strigosozonata (strain HHB-11173) TaxID=741275 RepID=UPI0004416DF5|nr:uncharacterized protein PUNSTDRAFT_131989 [Punctularia strigosozonata HHB-11173 SS5]EIN11837.1 hypothetical protein PUNSTDRAFT_131989 [Punctularia strigosozonata HHB-11173 SS5]